MLILNEYSINSVDTRIMMVVASDTFSCLTESVKQPVMCQGCPCTTGVFSNMVRKTILSRATVLRYILASHHIIRQVRSAGQSKPQHTVELRDLYNLELIHKVAR
jgi:hypothetical protein